jgi:cytochrome c-type biogenesis protein CcmE
MKKKYIIGGVIVLAALIYLLVLIINNSTSYYLKVSEFYDRINEFEDTNVRIAGKIAEGSIEWNAEELDLRFTITEGGDNLPVIYTGSQPNGFKADSNLLVEGKYGSDGIFHASQLIMRCSSKYEALLEE